MDTVKKGAEYVSEQAQKATSGVSKEANKQTAKDSDTPVGSRLSGAKDAASDKASETKHDAKAEAHKQQI
ncbi:uncharacterized protein UV8b_01736 [Ustilaginoidea virens]|uniref:Uncharacterized protein n=1 Tax=Ustilaginoidea virens TaxID=1159556 RepID=A0A063BNQ7_USTVR|nr:uncharacterized protein UV8b_01736 [Ustilaginoidea virens]QUC17495.1 hypothetical protein UV8b_01736 [Ustilaginoidea virens]GAO13643.1 hypothetical protein UVI_02017500 [Ustilaginoidea virens]